MGNYVPTAVGFQRISRSPLEKYELFNSVDDLRDYIQNGPVYNGQICTIVYDNNVLLSYRLVNINGKYSLKPLLNNTENHIMSKTGYEKYGFVDKAATVPNSIDNDKWLLIYNYDSTSKITYTNKIGYNTNPRIFNLLCTLELYNNSDGFKFLIAVNGEIKYKWKQTVNFMKVTSDTKTGVEIQYLADNENYILPLVVDGAATEYGLLPKKITTNNISLYIGV